MDWLIWMAVGMGALAIWGFMGLAKDGEQRDNLADLVRQHAGEGDVLCKKPQLAPAIGLAIREGEFFVGSGETVVRFPSSALIEATIQTDGATTTKVSRGSQLGGAAVGAVLAGPLGAAVGALSGSSRTAAAPPKDVRLRMVVDSDDFPLLDIPFIEATATGVTHGHVAVREADEWLARLKVMMRRAEAPAPAPEGAQ